MEIIKTYADLKKVKNRTIRTVARNIILSGLSFVYNNYRFNDLIRKPRVQFLYFHHLFPDEIENFRLFLSVISKYHEFISYSEAVDRIINRDIDRPYIAFSTDDGFKTNLMFANELEEFGATACFFINPNSIGLTDNDDIKRFCIDRLNFPPVEFLNWDDLDNLLSRGHEIGSHTMSHINIANASEIDIKDDMRKTFELLSNKFGKVQHFAFPFGTFNHFKKSAISAVYEAGFISCASAVRGCHINHNAELIQRDLCIRRDHIIAGWNINHILYFLLNNSKCANTYNNLFPYT